MKFDDFVMHDADSDRVFCWYALRDPLLPGSPDMDGADVLCRRIAGFTHAAAVSVLSCPCDTPFAGGCDHGPCV